MVRARDAWPGRWRYAGALAHRRLRFRASRLPAVWRGMLWVALSGVVFSLLNTILRSIALSLDPFQTLFVRYLLGTVVMLPLLWRYGWRTYMPRNPRGQLWRGVVHTAALMLWFTALPHITLADTTAIGFTGPIFIMLGAAWFLGEKMQWDRWVAALIGFSGVLVVVLPQIDGQGGWYTLVMLAAAPVFAASYLLSKSLSRVDSPGVLVFWQSIWVTVLGIPLGLFYWTAPTPLQWLGFLAAGLLGSLSHYCLMRSFRAADISSTQSLRFLDLICSSIMGWLAFSDVPSRYTYMGALVIVLSTVWIAQREHRLARLTTPA